MTFLDKLVLIQLFSQLPFSFSGVLSKKFINSSRGFCNRCFAIVWLNDVKFNVKHCAPRCKNHLINPVSTQKVAHDLMFTNPLGVYLRFINWIRHS